MQFTMTTVHLLLSTIFATYISAKSCSCDSSDDFIIVDELTCFMPIIDGYFPLPAWWAFPEVDFANLKARDINGGEYFTLVDDANEGKPGYMTAKPLTMGGVLILNDGLQILLDTGMGEVDPFVSLSGSSPTNLQQHLELLGCTDIDIVITSHMHFDHIGWNVKYNKSDDDTPTDVVIPSWGHPTVYFVQNDEYYYWQKLQLDDYKKQDPAYYKSKELLATHIDSLVQSGQIALRFGNYFVSNNVEVRRCIGHTPGHQCINLYNKEKEVKVMLIGDSIHSPYQVCVPDLCPSFDVSMDESRVTRKALIQQAFETHDVLFAPLHFPGIGQIIKCDTCNSQSGYVWKQLNKQELKEWSENQINSEDEDKTDL